MEPETMISSELGKSNNIEWNDGDEADQTAEHVPDSLQEAAGNQKGAEIHWREDGAGLDCRTRDTSIWLADMPAELILYVMQFLSCYDLCNCTQVSLRFTEITTAPSASDFLWENIWRRRSWKCGTVHFGRRPPCLNLPMPGEYTVLDGSRNSERTDWKALYLAWHMNEMDLTRRASEIVDQSLRNLALFQGILDQQRTLQEKVLQDKLRQRQAKQARQSSMRTENVQAWEAADSQSCSDHNTFQELSEK